MKRQGVGTLARMRHELDDGRIPTGPMTDGGLLALAGFLLLVPGFVTDVFGLAAPAPARARRGPHAGWVGGSGCVRASQGRRPPGYLDVDEAPGRPSDPYRPEPPELLP